MGSNTFLSPCPNSASNPPKQSPPGLPTRSPLPTGNPTPLSWYVSRADNKQKSIQVVFDRGRVKTCLRKLCRSVINVGKSFRPTTPSTTVVPAERDSVIPAPQSPGPSQRGAGVSPLFGSATPASTTGEFQLVNPPFVSCCVLMIFPDSV